MSAGNKGPGNKCREMSLSPCALNNNLLISERCSGLRDLIISDFLVPPGWLSVISASLSHIVRLLVWVSYYTAAFIYAVHS